MVLHKGTMGRPTSDYPHLTHPLSQRLLAFWLSRGLSSCISTAVSQNKVGTTVCFRCKAPVATSTLGSKKPSNISRTKNVALKIPRYPLLSLTKGYFGQFKGYMCSPGSFLLSFASWRLWVAGALQSNTTVCFGVSNLPRKDAPILLTEGHTVHHPASLGLAGTELQPISTANQPMSAETMTVPCVRHASTHRIPELRLSETRQTTTLQYSPVCWGSATPLTTPLAPLVNTLQLVARAHLLRNIIASGT